MADFLPFIIHKQMSCLAFLIVSSALFKRISLRQCSKVNWMVFLWWLKDFTHCYYLCSVFSVHEDTPEALFLHFFDWHVLVERDKMGAVCCLLLTWDPIVPQNDSTTFSEPLESAVNTTGMSTPPHTTAGLFKLTSHNVKPLVCTKNAAKSYFILIWDKFRYKQVYGIQ